MNRTPVLTLVALLAGCSPSATPAPDAATPELPAPAAESPTPSRSLDEALLHVELEEEILVVASTELGKVAHGLKNLRLPDVGSRAWFADTVRVRDVVGLGDRHTYHGMPDWLGIEEFSVSLATEERQVARDELSLLQPFLSTVDLIDDAKFSAADGILHGNGDFVVKIKMRVRGREASGGIVGIKGWGSATFRQESTPAQGERAVWLIHAFSFTELVGIRRAAGPIFEDVLPQVTSPELAQALRRSIHEEYVEAFMADRANFDKPTPYFDVVSHDRHPALSAADVDGDGVDELYVMGRWGKNQLLDRQPDGTFVDRAPELGLDIEGHTAAALFLDFDGDGDRDALLGRTLERSMLLMQEDGRFVERTDRFAEPAPMAVSALSAADVNGDGRLDVYVSTYSLHSGMGLDPTLAPSQEETNELTKQQHVVYDNVGPANVLLLGTADGGFVRAPRGLATPYRHTYQASFADIDDDGDQDLYLAHDYAPNDMLRNRGDGTFELITDETGTADVGFGMGASWGDYDGDGDPDLYVSNMFSKAGGRITRKLPGIDPRFAMMARGNSLFRNDGASFQRVSGQEKGTLQVEASGWSWGGTLADVTMDGWPDIAVLNGYFTAPARWSRPVDL